MALGDATRNGVWFRTPLSQSSCSDIRTKTDMIEALQNYIEVEFKFIGPVRCEELTYVFRHSWKDPELCLSLSRHNLQYSYDDVRKCMLAADCKEEFCRQLSDQLVFCERCGQRPILYNVIRDEDSMRRHLSDHKRESEIHVEEIERLKQMLLSKIEAKRESEIHDEEIERLKQMLLSKLEAAVVQSHADGFEAKNA